MKIASISDFLSALAETSGNISVENGIVNFPSGDYFHLPTTKSRFKDSMGPVKLVNAGEEGDEFYAEAKHSGDCYPDTGDIIYSEISIGVYSGCERDQVCDIVIGLNPANELRVAISTDGIPDQHQVEIMPLREQMKAVNLL